MQKQPSESFFIEFVGVSINKASKRAASRIGYSRKLLVKFVIECGNSLNNQKSLQWVETEAVQNTIKLFNASLRAMLLVSREEQKWWTLSIFGRERSLLDEKVEQLDLSEKDLTEASEIKKIGQCQISPLIYADVFTEYGKSKFQENIEISRNMSLNYEVFIHSSLVGLEKVLVNEKNSSEVPIVDTAFKKPSGNPKIRYVQLEQNRERSLKGEQFRVNNKVIACLKLSGKKYVSVSSGSLQKKKKNKDNDRSRESKKSNPGIPGQTTRKVSLKKSIFLVESKKNQVQIHSQNSVQRDHAKRDTSKVYSFLIFMAALVLIGYMMFPAKKI